MTASGTIEKDEVEHALRKQSHLLPPVLSNSTSVEPKMYGEYAGIIRRLEDPHPMNIDQNLSRKAEDSMANFDLDEDIALVQSSREQDAIQTDCRVKFADYFTEINNATIIVTGYPPFIVEWSNKSFAKATGFSSEEILGIDLRFLSGDGANGISIKELYDVVYTEKGKRLDSVTCYHKDGTLFASSAKVTPIYNYDKKHSGWILNNLAITLDNYTPIPLFSSRLLDSNTFFREVGLPVDRREYSENYRVASTASDLADAIGEITDLALDDDYAVADIVRYYSMTTTKAPIAITNRYAFLILHPLILHVVD
jgi:PAS domain-containing protein